MQPRDEASVNLSRGLPETVVAPAPAEWESSLAEALGRPSPIAAVSAVARAHPTFLAAWASLAELSDDDVASYAYARVGYHRGLDALRGAGWRGSGYVRWRHEENRGFLRSLAALRKAAAAMGETDEAERCATFLRQLDPDVGA